MQSSSHALPPVRALSAGPRARALASLFLLGAALQLPSAHASDPKPTIVLVHGAMADAASWSAVVPRLQAHGYTVVATPDPLRSVQGDADVVAGVVKSIKGPVVLVGHSYGGAVITNAAVQADNVKSLVYVAAFAPAVGESAFALVGKFPGSVLGAALATPVDLPGGGHDLHMEPAKFAEPFAADLPASQVAVLAASQRAVTEAALKEPSGSAAWQTLPSWFVYGSADKSIPPAAHAFMARRAKAREAVAVEGASHLVMLSQPEQVVRVIEDAAR